MPRRTDISKVLIIGSGPEALKGRGFPQGLKPRFKVARDGRPEGLPFQRARPSQDLKGRGFSRAAVEQGGSGFSR